jgi:hypothetical protein
LKKKQVPHLIIKFGRCEFGITFISDFFKSGPVVIELKYADRQAAKLKADVSAP